MLAGREALLDSFDIVRRRVNELGDWGASADHYTTADPFCNQAAIDTIAGQVGAAGASIEIFDYPGAGHLFTDPSLPTECDAQSADLLWSRVLPFCAAPPR